MKQRLVFWSNFSSVFVKWGMNIFYILLTVTMIYLCYLIVEPIIGLLSWVGTFDPVPMFMFVGKILVLVCLTGVAIYGLLKFKVFSLCCEKGLEAAVAVSPPFVLVGKVFAAPLVWIWKCLKAIAEFSAVFYEENCPPIKIVSIEEEKIQQKIEEAV